MFFKSKREKKERMQNYLKTYEQYLESGVDVDGGYNGKVSVVDGPYGKILHIDFGSKKDSDLNETIQTHYYEGEINSVAGRTYINFREQDFLEKNDLVYYGFIVDNEGIREIPLNLSNKDLTSILDMISYVRESLKQEENIQL